MDIMYMHALHAYFFFTHFFTFTLLFFTGTSYSCSIICHSLSSLRFLCALHYNAKMLSLHRYPFTSQISTPIQYLFSSCGKPKTKEWSGEVRRNARKNNLGVTSLYSLKRRTSYYYYDCNLELSILFLSFSAPPFTFTFTLSFGKSIS